MTNFRRYSVLVVLGGCFAAAGIAQQVTMQLTSPTGSGPVLGNVYISPYTALIGAANEKANSNGLITGVSTLVICDDFETDVSLATPPWQAIATNVASLATETTADQTLKYDMTASASQQKTDYTVAAYLATEILQATQQNNIQAEGDLSFALWGLFDQSATTGPFDGQWVTGQDLINAKTDLSNAQSYVTNNHLAPSNFSDVTIYTPSPQSASQEYIVVSAAEPPELALFAVELTGLMGLVYLFRRRFAQSSR